MLRVPRGMAALATVVASGCTTLAGLEDLDFGATSSSGAQATSSVASGGGAGGSGAGGGQAGAAGAGGLFFFSDDFERADDLDVGNGWIEKLPQLFEVSGGGIEKITGGEYRNNLVYRPERESQRDIEVTMEFAFLEATPHYPGLVVRAQPGTLTTAGTFEAYMLYVNDDVSGAYIGRHLTMNTILATLTFVSPLAMNQTYRLRLRAVGTDPVVLDGFIEEQAGARWNTIATGHAEDTAPARIAAPGTFGFTAHDESVIRYDNYAAFPP